MLIVILWGSTVFGLFSLAWIRKPLGIENISEKCDRLYGQIGSITDNVDGIFCHVGVSILNWLFCFAMFCFFGVTIIGLGNIGNYNMQQPRWYLPLIGSVAIVLPFHFYLHPTLITIGSEKPRGDGDIFRYTRYMAVTLLGIAIYLHM